MIALSTPLSELPGIQERFLSKLKRLGIETVKDLVFHFPTRYEDYSRLSFITDLIPHEEATIQGIVSEIGGRRSWRKHLYVIEALITDSTGSLRAVWFNQPYIKNVLQPGRLANFAGKVSVSEEGEYYLSNPTYELISEHTRHETRHTARIVPVYPETRGLTSKGFRYFIKPIIDQLEPIPEIIPEPVLRAHRLPDVNRALHDIHFPSTLDDALHAKKRFAFEDLFMLQLVNLQERFALLKERAVVIRENPERLNTLISLLPFSLTSSQKTALCEIFHDLAQPHPMHRLLQGDVGSGKTVLAALAAIRCAEEGYQTAFMAPTELLARQHFHTFTKLFPDFKEGIALFTSSESSVSYGHELTTRYPKTKLADMLAAGKIKVAIGTHALIQATVAFKNLALTIVDEQHRFGVAQRAAALTKNISHFAPHFLSMSATPIPRTLSLTLWSDLDLSLITELPKQRKPIITKIVAPQNREKAYAFIRDQIKKGRQAFVICPRIGENQKLGVVNKELEILEVKNVKEEYEKLSKRIFPDLRVGMLHGKMKSKEKEKAMREFFDRKFDVLVTTSVVEVGIDVPNATIMMIEGAEKFGLAQLYQFRGRVGRGVHQSFCFLFSESSAKTTETRLKAVLEAKNGFELAERDLRMRGPGEFLGNAQTGMPDIAMKAIQNPELAKLAHDAAFTILKKDQKLATYPLLRNRIEHFRTEVHRE